jgi:hypothetical protein
MTYSFTSRRDVLAGTGALLAFALSSARVGAAPVGDASSAAANWISRAAGSYDRPRLFHSVARGLAMIPGRAPVVTMAERGLHALAARPAGRADQSQFGTDSETSGATLVRSKFLGVALNPWTMKPIETHYNEITGTRLPVAPRRLDETTLIAGPAAIIKRDGQQASPRWLRISEARFGEETIISSFESALASPDARPSVTSLSFRAVSGADASDARQIDFSMALMFAAEDRPWLGFPAAQRVQIMLNVTGRSIDDTNALDEDLLARLRDQEDFLSFAG